MLRKTLFLPVEGIPIYHINMNKNIHSSKNPLSALISLYYLTQTYIYILISLRISGLDNLASVRLPTVVEGLQGREQSKRRPEMTGQTPSDEKVSMEFQMFWRFLFKRFLTTVLFRPVLYIGTLGRLFPQ